ncbi:MAG: hypothetical protein M1820_002882 [Bogoriella megaspora]|nr:MAG: hypothetical protein M1820_002882 [Bogoriella megaspora]
MRSAIRLLAAVKSQFLEAGTPTGLTGLYTHPSPRGSLTYLYTSTLDKLKHIPESSVYRQSTEALLKHRLSLVDSVKPEGYAEWEGRVKKLLDEHPELTGPNGIGVKHSHDGREFISFRPKGEEDDRITEWEGQAEGMEPALEGTRTEEERKNQFEEDIAQAVNTPFGLPELELEPPLTREQIGELESKIGAGLIEEVIQVAEGEHRLVNEMIKSRVWEELEEKPAPGQWDYFERNAHTATQQR